MPRFSHRSAVPAQRAARAATARTNACGFTLVELLVVIGIIAVLISVLLPALNKARQQAQVTACMANVKQLATAWVLYANDNHGVLPYAETSAAGVYPVTLYGASAPSQLALPDGWVIDVIGDPANGTEASVRSGALWKYAPAAATYRCPASTDDDIYRSYSISSLMNGSGTYYPPNYYFKKLSQVKPDRLVFIEENDPRVDPATGRRFNAGSFLMFHTLNNAWGDTVGLYHKKGTVLSFGDSHVEYRQWADKRTLVAQQATTDPGTTLNKDLRQLKIDYFGAKLLFAP